MHSHPEIDLVIARDLQQGARELAAKLRDARYAREARPLATSGPRASAARWMSRALLRAEPCPQRGDALS